MSRWQHLMCQASAVCDWLGDNVVGLGGRSFGGRCDYQFRFGTSRKVVGELRVHFLYFRFEVDETGRSGWG